jgi:surface antigen
MQRQMRTASFLAVLAVASLAAAPVQAQLGGLLRRVPQAAADAGTEQASDDKGGCPKGKKGSRAGRNILGGIIRDTVGDAASKAGVYSFTPIAEVSNALTNAIACKLDPAEQVQAAAATEMATRGEDVGSTAAWTSETRENVSGSSTVVARNDERGGRRCMNVTDFIIVEGEETRVTKRMCKERGQARYVLAEA